MLGHAIAPAASALETRSPALDTERVRDVVLVRIATSGRSLTRDELVRDLLPCVSHILSPSGWAEHLDRDLAALADAGLITAHTVGVAISEIGSKRAALVLALPVLPRTWSEARSIRLVARALGVENLPPRRLKSLQKVEGLRAAIVQKAFGLKIRGLPTPARLRIELARLALRRAFSDSLPADVTGKSGLSAKAGRSLAGRLANPPRDFQTDSRLIAALALEYARARKADIESLQTALLRRYLTKGQRSVDEALVTRTAKVRTRKAKPRAAAKRRPPSVAPAKPFDAKSALPADPPDFQGFVTAIRALADHVSDGWSGNRKAFISRIWRALADARPEWGLSEIEFKGMLAEAHRRSALVLATADLKDDTSIAEVQASAVVFKNTIFHYVRIDD